MDHSIDPELGIVDSKMRYFNYDVGSYGRWRLSSWTDHNKKYDYAILYNQQKEFIYSLRKKLIVKKLYR